jgi:hypothetical protein
MFANRCKRTTLLALALLALALLAAPPGAGLAQVPDYDHVLYMPYITREIPVTGRLTSNGSPVAGQTVVLRYSYDFNKDHNDFSSAVTRADGTFSLQMPRMNTPADSYYLLWRNTSGNSAWLSGFRGRDVFSTTQNHHHEINIADIRLVAPADGATVFSPTTFQWVMRATTSDSYSVAVEDESRTNSIITEPPEGLGYVDRATVGGSLPPWIKANTTYYWFVAVNTPSGLGVSYYRRAIKFQNASASPALDSGLRWTQPEPGSLLESWQKLER